MKEEGYFGKTDIPKNREPRNSSIEYHSIMNTGFMSVFGVPLRACSVFCTGDEKEASKYGKMAKIYPSDDFTVYWSDNIKDLFELSHNEDFFQTEEYAPFMAIYCMIADKRECRNIPTLKSRLNTWTFAKNFLERHFPDYLENYPDNAMKIALEILKLYPDSINNFVKMNYRKGNTIEDLQNAAASHNEILITGSYYCWRRTNG